MIAYVFKKWRKSNAKLYENKCFAEIWHYYLLFVAQVF